MATGGAGARVNGNGLPGNGVNLQLVGHVWLDLLIRKALHFQGVGVLAEAVLRIVRQPLPHPGLCVVFSVVSNMPGCYRAECRLGWMAVVPSATNAPTPGHESEARITTGRSDGSFV